MIIPAQNLLPSFETLLNTDAGKLFFAVFVIGQLALVWLCLTVVRSNNKTAERQAKAYERLDERQEHDSRERNEDYLYLKSGQETTNEYIKKSVAQQESMFKAIGEILVESANLHAETRKDLESMVGHEIASATERVLSQRGQALLNTVFQFPPPDDCRWRLAIVRWRYPDKPARIYKTPLYLADNNIIGNIKSSGEVVKIIKHTLIAGWYSITELEENPLMGYIDEGLVTIEFLPSKESESDEKIISIPPSPSIPHPGAGD